MSELQTFANEDAKIEAADDCAVGESASPRKLHALAVLSVCLVWPLIWVGGLVTTYDAGMAVPDWPDTYGDNLLLYPVSTWLSGPFDLFIEHGHRLLGAVVGVVAIAMVIAGFMGEQRRWVRGLVIGILLAVISQGALGGVRVLLSDRTIAMIHGCFGPVVFALCCVAMVTTSRSWWQRKRSLKSSGGDAAESRTQLEKPLGKGVLFFALLPMVLSYTQLVLGAQLRHHQPLMTPGAFTLVVALHIVVAVTLWLLTPILFGLVRRCGDLTLSRPAFWLILFVGAQILLGTGTWIVNYGWPSILAWLPWGDGYLVVAKGFVESMIVTAHVAVGSLILATSAVVFVQLLRQRYLASAGHISTDKLQIQESATQ